MFNFLNLKLPVKALMKGSVENGVELLVKNIITKGERNGRLWNRGLLR
jgi:hypothetical protein